MQAAWLCFCILFLLWNVIYILHSCKNKISHLEIFELPLRSCTRLEQLVVPAKIDDLIPSSKYRLTIRQEDTPIFYSINDENTEESKNQRIKFMNKCGHNVRPKKKKCGHNVFNHMFLHLHMQYVLDKFSSFTNRGVKMGQRNDKKPTSILTNSKVFSWTKC